MTPHGQGRRYGSTPYHEITGPDGLLANLQPFEGSTMRGITSRCGTAYMVYSYEKQILEVEVATGLVTYVDDDRYSVTTSTHQNYALAWTGRAVRNRVRAFTEPGEPVTRYMPTESFKRQWDTAVLLVDTSPEVSS